MTATTQMPNLLTAPEAAAFLGVTEGSLAVWRCTRRYLPFVKVGRCVRYDEADLLTFLKSRKMCADNR